MEELRILVKTEKYRQARRELGNPGNLIESTVAVYGDAMAELAEGTLDRVIIDGVTIERVAS